MPLPPLTSGSSTKKVSLTVDTSPVPARSSKSPLHKHLSSSRNLLPSEPTAHVDHKESRVNNSYSNRSLVKQHVANMSRDTDEIISFISGRFLRNRGGLDWANSTTDDEEIYECTLYKKLQADQLFNLAFAMLSAPEFEEEHYNSTVIKALDTYEEALDMCGDVLVPTNELKIRLSLKMSMALHDLSSMPMDAWVCGKKALLLAEKYSAISHEEMQESQVEALQVLRDHVSMLEVYLTAHRENKETKSGRKYCNLDSLAEEENDDGNRNSEQFEKFNRFNRKKSNVGSGSTATLTLAHRVEKIRRLMKLDNSKDFLMASELNHANQIVTSLHKIFKSYVRGNAVHAQTKTGTYVALDGRELDMDDFLLGGPYMSWDGFLFFCHDFNITPRRDGKGNRKLNTRAGESFIFTDNLEVQIVFTMTALAPHEILKMKNKKRIWSKGAREMWRDSTQIADASVRPRAGLNFENFVDCIARLGLVGLVNGTWAEMFPSSTDKIEAVFLTTMGLLDGSLVNANLHQHKKSQGLTKAEFKGMTALTRENSLKKIDTKATSHERTRRRSLSAPAAALTKKGSFS